MLGTTPAKRSLNTTFSINNTVRDVNASIVASDLERIVLEKQFNEERLLRELAYKDEALHLIQNQKNLKMDQYQLQVDEEILRIRRNYQLEIDSLNMRILQLDRQLRISVGREGQLVINLDTLSLELENTTNQLLFERQQGKKLSDENKKLKDTINQSDIQNQQLKNKNRAMQQQILILLKIEQDKTRQILLLQQNQKVLHNRILSLQLSYSQLQAHLKLITQNLRLKDIQCSQMKFAIDQINAELHSKNVAIQKLTIELQQLIRVSRIKQIEIKDLMRENERLYNEISVLRHQLHQLAITYNFAF